MTAADAIEPGSSSVPHERRAAAEEEQHAVLNVRRPFRGQIPTSSVPAVRAVAKLDARTHIVAARQPGGAWYRLHRRTRFTRQNAATLRAAGLSEVVLRRRLRWATFPLAWLSQR